jgi:uncharacterized membrane protein
MNKIQFDSLWNQTKTSSGFNMPSDDFGSLISKLIPFIFTISGIVLLFFIILSGFQMIFSAGDPKAAQAAKSKLTSAVIGFLIIFVSYWIVQIVGNVFKIQPILDIFK